MSTQCMQKHRRKSVSTMHHQNEIQTNWWNKWKSQCHQTIIKYGNHRQPGSHPAGKKDLQSRLFGQHLSCMGSIPNLWGHIKFRQADNNWLGELATTTAGWCVLTRLLCKPQLNSNSPRHRAADFAPHISSAFKPLHPSSPFPRSPSVLFSWLRRHINERKKAPRVMESPPRARFSSPAL